MDNDKPAAGANHGDMHCGTGNDSIVARPVPSCLENRMKLLINRREHAVDERWQDETLLTVLREALGLVGTKFGCGTGLCGACTVLVDGQAQRACLLPARELGGREVGTIEGLAGSGRGRALQQAWLDEIVPQCGYCQAGQLMACAALISIVPNPSDAQIDAALAGNLCRCGTQPRIRRALHRIAGGGAA